MTESIKYIIEWWDKFEKGQHRSNRVSNSQHTNKDVLLMIISEFENNFKVLVPAIKTCIEALKSISDFKSYEGALRPEKELAAFAYKNQDGYGGIKFSSNLLTREEVEGYCQTFGLDLVKWPYGELIYE